MKTKSYLHCIITAHDGRVFENPLKLSEAHLIATIAKENASVNVRRHTVSIQFYNQLFGG